MIKVGITGQSGFIGTHLVEYLSLKKDIFSIVPFRDEFFEDPDVFSNWVLKCDSIIHLAALNRHDDEDQIYLTNIKLIHDLIQALEVSESKAHVIFSSSTQEEMDNPYGRSKKEGRKLLSKWAEQSGGIFTGLVIPNVFGPFGHPFYNSVVATFCHLLAKGEEPTLHDDKVLRLIYVGELAAIIEEIILDTTYSPDYQVSHTSEVKVSTILELLNDYKSVFADTGQIPSLNTSFEINLFNTFRCSMDIQNHFPVLLDEHVDDRGSFVETMKLGVGGQVSFSTTKPGITRGNHFHTRKIERFVVIRGRALIQLRRTGTKEVFEFHIEGSHPAYVDMPIWFTHNITNVGEDDLYTLFWINEFYDPEDPDTFYEKV